MAVLLLRRQHFSLAVFRIFFSSLLNFQQFDYDMSESGIVCLFCLKFTELLEFVCIVLLSNLRYFRPLFLLIFFLHYVFFSSLSEAPVINARSFWLLSHRSLRLLSLFQFIFLSDVQIESLSLVNPPAH